MALLFKGSGLEIGQNPLTSSNVKEVPSCSRHNLGFCPVLQPLFASTASSENLRAKVRTLLINNDKVLGLNGNGRLKVT